MIDLKESNKPPDFYRKLGDLMGEYNTLEIRKCRLYLGSAFDFFKREIEVCYIIEGKLKDEVISTSQMVGLILKL